MTHILARVGRCHLGDPEAGAHDLRGSMGKLVGGGQYLHDSSAAAPDSRSLATLPGLAATQLSFRTPSGAFLRLQAGVDSASILCTILACHPSQKPAVTVPGDSMVPCCGFCHTVVTGCVCLVP